MPKHKKVVKPATKKSALTPAKPATGEKESKLIALLSGKDSYTLKEIIKKTGYAEASAKMYTQQSYLDRKEKPYKVIESKKGLEAAYRYEAK